MLGSAAVHYHLWGSAGYSHITVIGPLFLAQAVVGVVLAVSTSVTRHPVLVVVEAGFIFSSAAALVISVNWGLFGWQDSMGAPYAGAALSMELCATVVLLAAFALLAPPWWRTARWRQARQRPRATGH